MTGKKKKGAGIRSPAPAALRAHGLEEADPIGALDKLGPQWGSEPDLEAWAVAAAGRLDDPSVAPRLDELQSRTSDKSVRREIKRALYRLEQQGHWQKPAAAPPPSARELVGTEDNAPLGWLSPIDRTGTRLVWMAGKSSGGLVTLSAVTNEDHGLLEFHSGKTTRKALREAQKGLEERSGVKLVETPWSWTYELVRRAIEKTERGRFPDAVNALRTVAPTAPGAVSPAVDGVLDRSAVAGDEDALRDSAALLEEPEIGSWLLPLPWLEPILEKLSASESSLVVVSPAAREERTRETLEEATASVLDDPERRARFADRLEESAFLLAHRNATGAARMALAAALATRAEKPIPEIPVLAEITRRSLAIAQEARNQQEAEETKSSLVVTPQQALAEQQRGRRGR